MNETTMQKGKTAKRLVITSEMLKRAYLECLEKERISEWHYLTRTAQGRFWANSVLRVDFDGNADDSDFVKDSWLSDNWRGADEIRSFDEPPKLHDLAWRMACINRVKHRLARTHPEALPVFWLILKNGKNRKASFAWLDEHWDEVMALKKQRKEASCRAKAKRKHTPRPSKHAAKGTAKSAVRGVPTSRKKAASIGTR